MKLPPKKPRKTSPVDESMLKEFLALKQAIPTKRPSLLRRLLKWLVESEKRT